MDPTTVVKEVGSAIDEEVGAAVDEGAGDRGQWLPRALVMVSSRRGRQLEVSSH